MVPNEINSKTSSAGNRQAEDIDTSTTKIDIVVSVLRGTTGTIPWIGPLIGEVITNIIPNQRIDRIDRYLHGLATRVKTLEKKHLEDSFKQPEFIDLFEDSLYQAARAMSNQRLDHIASLIKNSLSDEEVHYIRYKHALQLLGELNDIQILILMQYTLRSKDSEEFWEKHKEAISVPTAVMDSPQAVIDQNTIHSSYKEHLVRLGLLRHRFKKPKKGETPEFDEKTGMVKASGYDISSLGRLLLRYIDM